VQRKWLIASAFAGGLAMAAAVACGVEHPLGTAVSGIAVLAPVTLAGALILDGTMLRTLRHGRRQYAGFLIHLGLMCLAVGVTGSSLGKREQGFTLTEGQTVEWAGRSVRVAGVHQRKLPDKLVGEAVLEISRGGRRETTLVPAQHYHPLQDVWTTEVAVQSTWAGDFYTILHSGTEDGQLSMTFVENPLMRWLWLGGAVMVLGTVIRLWPRWRSLSRRSGEETGDERRQEESAPGRKLVPPHVSRVHEHRLRASAETVRLPAGASRRDSEEIVP